MKPPMFSIKRPLVDKAFVQFALDKAEDEVLWLIECGELAIVFDLRNKSSRAATYRILTSCVHDYAMGLKPAHNAATVKTAIEGLFPLHYDPTTAAIARKFACGGTHIIGQVHAKNLEFAGGTWRRGPLGAPKVKRASVIRYLI